MRRAGLDALLVIAVAIGVWFVHARHGIERFHVALGLLYAGSLARRVLAGSSPWVFAFEAAGLLGFAPTSWRVLGLASVGLATLVPLPRDGSPARRAHEALSVLVALAGAALAGFFRIVPDLASVALHLAIASEACAGRTTSDSGRRAARFAVAGAALVVRQHAEGAAGPLAEDLLVALGAIAITADAFDARRANPVTRLAWALLVLALLGRITGPIPFEIAVARGSLGALVSTGVLAATVFLLAARALSSGERPGGLARSAATVLACVAALEGALWYKASVLRSDPDAISAGVTPLVAFTNPAVLDPRPGPRPDQREHVFTPAKTRPSYRIVLLGGSSAYGLCQKDRATSPAGRLEAALAAARPGPAPEVICLAIPAFTSDQELGFLLGGALDWNVDLFLALDGFNDAQYLARKSAAPAELFGWYQQRHGFAHPLERWLLRRSMLLRPFARTAFAPHPADADELSSGLTSGFWEDGLVANEEAMAILARDAGAAFAWASVPITLDRPRPGPGEDAALATNGLPLRRRGVEAAEMARRHASLRSRVGAAVARRGGLVIDLPGRIARRSASAAEETWFLDECHWSDRGVEVVAEELVAALVEAGVR